MIPETAEQRATLAQLEHLVTTAPAAVSELLQEFAYVGPPTVEALVLAKQAYGAAFTDELFILLQSAGGTGGRFAGFTSSGTASPEQRTTFGKIMDSLYGVLVKTGLAKGATTAAGSEDANEEEAPEKRILGLAQPVFILLCAVLAALGVVVLIHEHKK